MHPGHIPCIILIFVFYYILWKKDSPNIKISKK